MEHHSKSKGEMSTQSARSYSFDLWSTAHKRRGGFGRNAENSWVLRGFSVNGSILCYYDAPDILKIDPSRPRGRIDLSREEISVEMIEPQNRTNVASFPTEYPLIIHAVIMGTASKKWELCFETRDQQKTCHDVIERFQKKREEKHSEGSSDHVKPLLPKSKSFQGDGDSSANSRGALLRWHYRIRSALVSWFDRIFTSRRCLITVNMAILLARLGSAETFIYAVVIINLILFHNAKKQMHKSSSLLANADYSTIDTVSNHVMEAGSTIRRAPPKRRHLANMFKKYRMTSEPLVRAFAEETNGDNECHEPLPFSYWNVHAPIFKLRTGPNYKRNHVKAPSSSALYDLISVDIIKDAHGSVWNNGVVHKFRIPDIAGITDIIDTGHPSVPPMIVINAALPTEESGMFGNAGDAAPGVIVRIHLAISKTTLEELKDIESASPAVKLLAEWCSRGEDDAGFRGRFKAMAVVDNMEQLGLPSFIQGFNGKPTLITKSGTFTRHDNFIEMSINVHHFAYIAKKCLFSIRNRFQHFILNVGFTIEGREDDELPEVLLGGMRLIQLDLSKVEVVHD